tara:strand:+ start:734 stop:1000 length:267 start_codon:yes stop_codon:yes gene_type:complete
MFKLTETIHIGASNCNAMTITTEAEDLEQVGRQFVTAMTNAGASKEDGQQAWEMLSKEIGDRFYTHDNAFTFEMNKNVLRIERIKDQQ